jgi:tetratricopeptide (TPR) repeat protein
MKQKLSFCILPIVVAFLFFTCVVNEWNAGKRKQLEREASELTRSGYKIAALEKYSELVRKHPAYGYGWILYSRQLYYFNRIEEARENLREGMNYFVDNMAYKLKADIEKALGDYAGAEKSYLHAIYMVPNRMGSRFNLLNFYAAENDTAKIIFWGISILKMPVKVVSEKTDILLLQTRSVIEKVTR